MPRSAIEPSRARVATPPILAAKTMAGRIHPSGEPLHEIPHCRACCTNLGVDRRGCWWRGREVHPLIWAVDEDGVVGRNFLVGDRDQLYLLPVSISEWLPEDHLAWFVLDAVDEMDLDGF